MVGWEQPELFYILPCQYNYRTDDETDNTSQYKEEKFKETGVFGLCNQEAKILHKISADNKIIDF